MVQRPKTLVDINTANKINKQFVSNPINSIFEKVKKIGLCQDLTGKSEKISEIVDYIHCLSDKDLLKLMANESEVLRSLAARSYVDNSNELSINVFKTMITDKNEFVRDSAVMALCYMNSDKVLDLLHQATSDNSSSVKMKALTGIADIAAEYSSKEAREILQKFTNDRDDEIRQFVTDELSFLN